MNVKTAKLINQERVERLLECYGANPKSWPDDERATALALIQHSDHLKQLQSKAAQLDQLLVEDPITTDVADSALLDRIVSVLPAQDQVKRRNWWSKHSNLGKSSVANSGWIGMIAASVAVFAITFSIVELHSSRTPRQQNVLTQQQLDNWMWSQIGGDTDSDDDEPLTMMSFFEM